MKTIRAQSVIEYALLIGIVASALLAMQVYVKRGVQAGIKVSTDQNLGGQSLVEFDQSKRRGFTIFSEQAAQQSKTNTLTLYPDRQETSVSETSTVNSSSQTLAAQVVEP